MVTRLAGVLAVVLVSYSLVAQQFHGVGASVTSSSPTTAGNVGRGSFHGQAGFGTPGVPPSVTSITPGFSGMPRSFDSFNNSGRRGRHGHHGRRNNFGAVFIPYAYPFYSYGYSDLYPDATPDNTMDAQPQDPQPPALTIFENRPGYRPPPVDRADSLADTGSRYSDRAAVQTDVQPAREPQPVADQAPTVLVFRDGRHLEIGNYAIQGDMLYNLDGKGPRKIKLADLDLAKTVQANDERGNEFRLPKNYRG